MMSFALVSWLVAIWLGSAWTEGLIGVWGMWTSLGIGSFWLGFVVIAKFWGGETDESNQSNSRRGYISCRHSR